MPHVRSVSIGVWLTRGSRHETDERERHRALRRAHALQGHRRRASPRTSRRRSTRSAASSTPSPRRNTPATTSRCSTSTCRWPSTCCRTSCMRPALRRRRHRAREEGHPRRDQDGRGHARRSRPRAVHAALLGRASARPADSRHPRRRSKSFTPRVAARLFRAAPTSRRT